MKKNYIFPIVLGVVVICLIIIIGRPFKNQKIQTIVVNPTNNSATNTQATNTPVIPGTASSTTVTDYSNAEKEYFENYLTKNLSTLSPEKEVLGGKFYITKLAWLDNQTAVVEYEDGHIALKAEVIFGFSNQERTDVKVESFKMLPPK